MLLTKECDYGFRIVRSLSNGEKKTVRTICESELIPEKYAYKILKKMEKGGILQAVRGRDGGYILTKDLNTFTIHDISVAVEETLYVFECLRKDKHCAFKEAGDGCAVHKELDRIQGHLIAQMQARTMAEIIGEFEEDKEENKEENKEEENK